MRFGTRRVLVASVIVAAAVGAGLTLAFDSSPTRPSGPAKPGYLYALDAHRGTLVRNGGPGEYDLPLFGVHRTAIQFLHRPGNSVSAISVAKLLSRFFTPEGTVSAPPNAAVNALVPGRGNHQYLMGVTLLTARYDRMHAVLRFHVRLLKQGAPRNRERGRT